MSKRLQFAKDPKGTLCYRLMMFVCNWLPKGDLQNDPGSEHHFLNDLQRRGKKGRKEVRKWRLENWWKRMKMMLMRVSNEDAN